MKLKSIIGIVALMLLCLKGKAQEQAQASLENYTLQQCIEYAMANAAAVKNALVDERIARAKVGEVRAAGLPQISAQIVSIDNFKIPKVFLPAQILNPNAEPGTFVPVTFQPQFTGQASVNLNQMVFNGSYLLGLKAANVYTELSTKSTQASKTEVAANVSKAYYLVLVNQERMGLVEQNYQRLEQLLKDTRAMYENGFVEKIDVDRIEVAYNNLKIERENLLRLTAMSYELLKFQMGLHIEDKLTLGQSIKDVQLQAEAPKEGEKTDYNKRIDFSLLQTQRQLNMLAIKNYRAGYLPSVFFFAGYGANSGTNSLSNLFNFGDYWFTNGNFGIQFNIPVFDGLQKHYQMQQGKLSLIKTENNINALQKAIDLEVANASVSLKNSLESLAAQKQNMELALEISRVTKIKYKEGVGSNIEVLNAETAYKEAESNYYNALYQALVSKVDLDKAKGDLLK